VLLVWCDFSFQTALNTDIPVVSLLGGFRKLKQRSCRSPRAASPRHSPTSALVLLLVHHCRPASSSVVQYCATMLFDSRGGAVEVTGEGRKLHNEELHNL
jgi:hypothetical protein